MICTTTKSEDSEETITKEAIPEKQTADQTAGASINAITKGAKKGDKGQRKGYGPCWECGEYGRPRRECKIYFERIGIGQQPDLSALTCNGKYGKGGKWGK